MASVDGSKSVLYASDEIFDHVCIPCKTGNVAIEAKHYCQVCNEYLCDACKNYHRQLSATASHKIVSGNKLPFSIANIGHRPIIYCSCNRNQPAEVYCEDHEDVVCMSCHKVKHSYCQTETVKTKSRGYTSSTLDEVFANTTYFKTEFDRLLNLINKSAEDLKSTKKSCEMEISKYRKEINIFLDSLERTLLQKLDVHAKEQQYIIDRHISSLTTANQMINSNNKQLIEAKSDGRSATMFTADIQATKNLMKCDLMLCKVENDFKTPTFRFEKNKMLENIRKNIDALGDITVCYKEKDIKAQKLLMNMKVTSAKQVLVRQDDDLCQPCIYACTFMPNGYLVLCDTSNYKIKVLNNECKLIDKLQSKSCPWCLSPVGSYRVIVTLPAIKQLQYIRVFPKTKCGSTIQLDKQCCSIAVSDHKIFVSCDANEKEGGDIRILDLEGKQMQKIDLEQTGILKCPAPDYLTIDRISKMIYFSNRLNPSSVTCLTFDGKVVFRCTSQKLKEFCGIYVDATSNVYVCDSQNNSVNIIAKDGRYCGTLIGHEDGLKHPNSIAVRGRDFTLAIGCWKSDNIFLFKFS